MKKIICIAYFIAFTVNAFSQINIKDGQFTGIGPFNLGDAVDKFGSTITKFDSSVWKGKLSTTYGYAPAGNAYNELAGIRFQSCLLSFDEANKLEWIQLVRLRLKQDSTISTKKLNKEIEQLVNYTNEATGIQAKRKLISQYKSVKSYIYQWKGATAIIQLDISYRDKENLGYSFVVKWKVQEDVN